MHIILYIIILSLLVAGGFLLAFFWAVKDGQYEDDFTPSMRLLVDDDMLQPVQVNENQNKTLASLNKTEDDRSSEI